MPTSLPLAPNSGLVPSRCSVAVGGPPRLRQRLPVPCHLHYLRKPSVSDPGPGRHGGHSTGKPVICSARPAPAGTAVLGSTRGARASRHIPWARVTLLSGDLCKTHSCLWLPTEFSGGKPSPQPVLSGSAPPIFITTPHEHPLSRVPRGGSALSHLSLESTADPELPRGMVVCRMGAQSRSTELLVPEAP